MAFVDTDEFFVLMDTRMASLPDLLQEYEEFGGLAVNWQVFNTLLSSCSVASVFPYACTASLLEQ